MTRLVPLALLVAAGCGGGAAATPSTRTPSPPPPPAAETHAVAVEEVPLPAQEECTPHELAIRWRDRDGNLNAEQIIPGDCNGACTPEDKRAGEQALADAEAQVAAGETSSILDYNFTECYPTTAELVRYDDVGGRDVALISGEHRGPHDINNRYFRIGFLDCGKLFLSDDFGSTYANTWSPETVTLVGSERGILATGQLTPVDPLVPLYKLTLDPRCEDRPGEQILDASAF
jgi:hypothetical protein